MLCLETGDAVWCGKIKRKLCNTALSITSRFKLQSLQFSFAEKCVTFLRRENATKSLALISILRY